MRDPEFPRDVLLAAQRIQAMRDNLDGITRQLYDLYLLAHERPTTDGPKVSTSTEGYAQLAANEKAFELWRRLTRRPTRNHPAPTLLSVDDLIALWHSDLKHLFSQGERASRRIGVPIRDAELAAAREAQERRKERGEYTPVRTVAQPGPVRR